MGDAQLHQGAEGLQPLRESAGRSKSALSSASSLKKAIILEKKYTPEFSERKGYFLQDLILSVFSPILQRR
jgi:hypothetical protein